MQPFAEITALKASDTVRAIGRTLHRIDPRLVDHGERVAFIACALADAGKLPLEPERLFLLALFHDIGAYKTEEIDRMVEFETAHVHNHAVYGYLFLKHLSPLSDMAEAILYHHTPWSELEHTETEWRDYAALLHLADRIDIAFLCKANDRLAAALDKPALFQPAHTRIACAEGVTDALLRQLADGSYRAINEKHFARVAFPPEDTRRYLEMLAYSIDFRSEHTVTHTINTVAISLNVAEHFGLGEDVCACLYLGALLHDAGKIAIPLSILEHPGRLTEEQMGVMRTHVAHTEQLIEGIVSEAVRDIAIRHHEKLDGSGYPYALTGDMLDLPQRIVAVADVVSALTSRRSYKEPFPKHKTLAILRDMSGTQLDADVCNYIVSQYDDIMEQTGAERSAVIRIYRSIRDEYEQSLRFFT